MPITRRSIVANFLQDVAAAEYFGGSVCLLSGSSGLGKTETITQFLSLVPPEIPLLTARPLPTGSPSLFPIYRAIETARLKPEVRPVVDEYIRTVPLIREIVDPLGGRFEPAYPTGLVTSELHTFCALGGLLRVIAAQGVIVMFIDDAQWLDMTSVKFIGYMIQYLDQLPLLLFLATKTNGAEAEGVRLIRETLSKLPSEKGRQVSLPPLNIKETQIAVERILGVHVHFCHDDLVWLNRSANGNPKYLAEIIALLKDRKQLLLDQDGRVSLNRQDQVIVPPSLAEIVRSRIRETVEHDTLADSAIHVAAVIGRRFNVRQIAKVLGTDPHGVMASLERLAVKTQYLHRLGASTEMEFDHDITREALLGSLGDLAQDIHSRFAQILTAESGSPREIAHHLRAAGKLVEAASYFRKAAKDAFLSGAYSDAADLFREQDVLLASSGLGLQNQERMFSIIRRGRSLLLAEDYEAASELLRPMCEQFKGAGHHARCLHLLGKASARLPSAQSHEESVTVLKAAVAASVQEGPKSFVARLWTDLISAFDSVGQYEQSEKAFRAAMHAAHLSREPSLMVRVLRLTCIFWQPDKVVAAIKRALTIARSYRLAYEYALCLNNLGTAFFHLGQYERSKSCLAQCSRELSKLGGYRMDVPLSNLGLVSLSESNLPEARSYLSNAMTSSRDPHKLLFIRSNLAVLKAIELDYDGAASELEAIIEMADASGDLYYRDCLRHNFAQVLIRRGQPETAVRLVEECPIHHDAPNHQLVLAKRATLLIEAYKQMGRPIPSALLAASSELERSAKPQAWLFRLPWYLCDIEFWED